MPLNLQNKTSRTLSLCYRGESFVCLALAARGYLILRRNFRKIGCEIDIIARKGCDIVIIEVKTRTRKIARITGADIESLLPPKKKKSLVRGALCYLAENDLEYASIRLDLALALYEPHSDTFALNYFANIEVAE